MNYLGEQFTTIFEVIRPEIRPEQNFALVLNAPPEVAYALDDVRRRYDPAYKLGIAPHITVKRPARLNEIRDIELLRQVLGEVIHDLPSISVQLRGYGVFRRPDANVLFLKVENEAPFYELHMRVLAGLSRIYPNGQADHFESDSYHPHLTIGNQLSDFDLVVLEHELTSSDFPLDFSFTLDHLSFLAHHSGKPWQAVEDFKFVKIIND